MEVPETFGQIKTPCRLAISGPSESGKSRFLSKLLQNREHVFTESFDRIIYSYPKTDKSNSTREFIEKLQDISTMIEIFQGIPDIKSMLGDEKVLVIIDDQSELVMNDSDILSVCFVHSHHANLSLVFTVQNLFLKSTHGKSISRNLTGLIVFKNLADVISIQYTSLNVLGKRLFLEKCFEWLNEHPEYQQDGLLYLYINTHPQLKYNDMRTFTNIFPTEDGSKKPLVFSIN